MCREVKTEKEVINEHLKRFYSEALAHGGQGLLPVCQEYTEYFYSMYQGLFIDRLKKELADASKICSSQNCCCQEENASNNFCFTCSPAVDKPDVQD